MNPRLPRMYSCLCAAVNAAALGLGSQALPNRTSLVCDARLTPLFTPPRPQLGRYEVCTTPEPLTARARPNWTIEQVEPLDAFGLAGSFDRGRMVRLYGGRRVTVARGYVRDDEGFVAITLISPYPNRELTALDGGTLVIRHFVPE